MLCEKCEILDLKAMKALESLTPGGSEFVNDVERCVAIIRDTQRSIIRFAKRNKKLREALQSIQALASEDFSNLNANERLRVIAATAKEAVQL